MTSLFVRLHCTDTIDHQLRPTDSWAAERTRPGQIARRTHFAHHLRTSFETKRGSRRRLPPISGPATLQIATITPQPRTLPYLRTPSELNMIIPTSDVTTALEAMDNTRFLVHRVVSGVWPGPVISVDGEVRGEDLHFDHHRSGERTNLLAIPQSPPRPGTIATPMLDTDAVISAAVLLLRSHGLSDGLERTMPLLMDAASYCDHLVPTGDHEKSIEEQALGFHLWLKAMGFGRGELLAWRRGQIVRDAAGCRLQLDSDIRSSVFEDLVAATVCAIRTGAFPSDRTWVQRIAQMRALAREGLVYQNAEVAVISTREYVDPLALYEVCTADIVVRVGGDEDAARYSIGLHPRAAAAHDLRHLARRLGEREAGWGGRENVIGSPRQGGSGLTLDAVLAEVSDWMAGGT